MGWFGRKSMEAARVPAPIPPWAVTGAVREPFPKNYQSQMEQVYVSNPVGQRAVRLVAGATAALPLYALEGKARVLELIERPGLLEAIAAQLLLHGNVFVQCVPHGRGVGELHALRPERVSVVSDARGWPAAYLHRVGPGQPKRLPARDELGRRQIIHLRALNPSSDTEGLGCLSAAIGPAALHNQATRWNKALLDNAARPSGALVYEPADGSNLSQEQFARLRTELDGQFAGSDNAGRPLLLEGGLKWQAMSLTPADMDFIALKEAAARDIALAFGVPPVLLGLPGDTSYANMREAGRALYRQTVLPLAAQMLNGLSEGLSDWYGKARVVVDTDKVSELSEERERLWSQVEAASFLSREEKRELVGYGVGEIW